MKNLAKWPIINNRIIEEDDINLPIQIKGKLQQLLKLKKATIKMLLNEIYRTRKK